MEGISINAFLNTRWKTDASVKDNEGGQGVVIKMVNIETGQLGALKSLHFQYLNSIERRLRMAEEVIALTTINGDGVPKIIEHNMEQVNDLGNTLYFIAEWIEGLTISQFVNGKARTIDEALDITRRLIETVKRCHELGIYHRDIKPDNIMINVENSNVTLIDFGIAWCCGRESNLKTEVGQELGNRFLRIPDLAAGRERRDPRADVTMCVGIFFYLLTGKTPRVLIDEKLKPPHEALSQSISEKVYGDERWHLIKRIFDVGFQPDIGLRFQNADDLNQRIKEILTPIEKITTNESLNELEEFNRLFQSAIIQSRQRVEKAMLDSSRKIEHKLREMAVKNGLLSIHNSSWAWVSVPGKCVEFSYDLVRKDAHLPRARIQHKVELTGPENSYVEASYRVEDGGPKIYYKGPASDLERLDDELEVESDKMFAAALKILRTKIEQALS